MDLTEKTLASKLIFDGKIIRVYHDDIELPNGKLAKREVVSHNGGAAILPIISNNVLLVKQYRYPYHEELLEIPAGKLEKGESAKDCVIRELKEEVGCIADNIIDIGHCYPTPGYTNEKLYIFIATELSRGETAFDEDEFINVVEMPFDTAYDMVMSGEIKDAKTVIAILKAKVLLNL